MTTILPIMALGARVPRDSPVRKVLKLKRFANEWLITNFGADSKVHKHWMQKITRNALRFKVSFMVFCLKKISTFFKARYEECGNTEDEYVAKVMAAYMAAQEQQAEQSRKRRAKGGQGGSRGKGKGKSNI